MCNLLGETIYKFSAHRTEEKANKRQRDQMEFIFLAFETRGMIHKHNFQLPTDEQFFSPPTQALQPTLQQKFHFILLFIYDFMTHTLFLSGAKRFVSCFFISVHFYVIFM